MIPDFYVFEIDFDTEEFKEWNPPDPTDCEVWSTVNVGDGHAGAYYQVHVCTPKSIRKIDNKRHCFVINEFRDVDDLINQMNAFIEDKIANKPGDPYRLLSNFWMWEYRNYKR